MSILTPFAAALLLVLAACASSSVEGADDAEKVRRIEEMYDGYVDSFPGVPAITAKELVELRKAEPDLVVVDVREPEEQAVSMIPGALTRADFEARADELRGREVVTYCTIGYRSGLYAKELRERGWEAKNLRGSILSWTHAGQPLVASDGPTRRVHVYGERWALAADGYEQVW